LKNILLIACALALAVLPARAQKLIDEIVAVVGDEIVLYSDVQIQINQLKAQGYTGAIEECRVLEDILFEKIMLNQAKVDSIEVTDDMVQGELNKRLAVFVRQIGSEEELEKYYGKSMNEIRDEFAEVLKDQILVQRMESEITASANVTPGDVENFYKSIPVDSLPFINASVELGQIAIYPLPSVTEVERVRTKLREFKTSCESGKEDFETLAALYSEDPGSSSKGGALGLKPRGTWVPEFDAVAFNLKEGQISSPFKTDYGFHIMQMVERRGELYNANHILLIPKVTSTELNGAKAELDSVRTLLLRDSLSFAFAAVKFSSDERSKNQNGAMVNPANGSTIFEMDELDPTVFLAIDTLEVGEVTQSFYFQGQGRERGYRIVKLKTRTAPHRANLVDDYQNLQNMASQKLSSEVLDKWMRRRVGETYVKINKRFADCAFTYEWIKEKEQAKN